MTTAVKPTPGVVEQRSAPAANPPSLDGRRLHGVIPYGVESRDLGGFREVMEPGALKGADTAELVATVDHAGVPLGRFPTTLSLEDRDDGLHWSLELPESRADIREAIERGDLRSTSWRMVVAEDRWAGDVRHVESVAELRDVSVVTSPAYSEARAEYRAAPEGEQSPDPPPDHPAPPQTQEAENMPDAPAGGLHVEDRAATAGPTIEERVRDAFRSIPRGESRSLSNATAEAISPPDLNSYVWDRLRGLSVVLASGVRTIPTDRREVQFPKITGDVAPEWLAELETITASDPVLGTLTAVPKKLAARTEVSNEVIDDSEPSITELLDAHMLKVLALKLDAALLEGNAGANADSINGLKFTGGIQTLSMGTNGAALTNLDPFVRALGALATSNVPGPFAIVMHPRSWLALALLRESADSSSNVPLLATGEGVEENVPARIFGHPVYLSSQLNVAETKGSASNASSAYIYSTNPDAGPAVVSRQDAEIELDRSRLFDKDASEVRGKLRADLIVPNAAAVVRVEGIIPAA